MKILISLLIAVVAVAAIIFFPQLSRFRITPQPSPSTSVAPSSRPEYIESAEGNIRVYGPVPNAQVGFNFGVTGQARVFENVVSIRIENQDNQVMYEGHVDAASPDVGQFGWFLLAVGGPDTQLKYKQSSKTGTVTVFAASAKDGSETNVVKIPVSFSVEENNVN